MIRLEVGRKQKFLTINDTSVSGLHAYLFVNLKNENILLMDCNSTNGTYLYLSNQWKRVSKVYLEPNLKIRLGSFEFVSDEMIKRVKSYVDKETEQTMIPINCCEKTNKPTASKKPENINETPKRVEKKEKNNKVMRDEYGNIIQAKG